MNDLLETLLGPIMSRGGWVMWPLLVMSLIAMTLMVERAWFWAHTNSPRRLRLVRRLSRLLRQGDAAAIRAALARDDSVYGRVVNLLLDEAPSEAVATEAIESQRPRLERFMPTLSTIITAAPMLGILGTVTGIIASFQIMSAATVTDPQAVGAGIAEALLTTAAGLVVALVVLLPYNVFRAQIDRTMGRIETLLAAAMHQGRQTESAALRRSGTADPLNAPPKAAG
jgi:biopolymer transport protein ExbB